MIRREIVLIGERDFSKRAHAGIEASIALFQRETDPALTFRWVSTGEITTSTADKILDSATGVWCTPGSPYENTWGALQAIRYAREKRCAFLGTCGGFQHALMEYCQNVLGRAAAHQELESSAVDPLIVKLTCSMVEIKAKVLAVRGSEFEKIVGGVEFVEEFHCNYGLASSLEPVFAASNLKFVAYDEAKQVRAFQLSGHPFFVGTLFQPERRALSGSLHPLVRTFLHHS